MKTYQILSSLVAFQKYKKLVFNSKFYFPADGIDLSVYEFDNYLSFDELKLVSKEYISCLNLKSENRFPKRSFRNIELFQLKKFINNKE